MNTTTAATLAPTHPFERAKLGTAPFRYLGCFESKYQAIPGDPSCPIQPGSSCDYCGQGIMLVCRVRGSGPQDKEFKVGCDCIRRLDGKTNAAPGSAAASADALLLHKAATAQRKHNLAVRKARQDVTIAAAREAFETHAELLRNIPHAIAYQAARGLTLHDEYTWMLKNGKATGQERVSKRVLAAVKEFTTARYSVDGDPACTLAEMFPDGDYLPEVLKLRVGERYLVGGGGAAAMMVERLV